MLQISHLKENDCNEMIGEIFCECLKNKIQIVYDKKLSIEFINRAVAQFNKLYFVLLNDLCKYTTSYCIDTIKKYPDVEYKKELYEIETSLDILNYIQIDELKIQDDKGSIVFNIAGGCDWSDVKGIQWIIKDKKIVYVGPWYDFEVWSPDLDDPFFNYCNR